MPFGKVRNRSDLMTDLLEHLAHLPTRTLAAGDVLIADGTPQRAMFVLVTGELETTKGGTTISSIVEPGSLVGEVSALIGSPATATVTARSAATVLVADDAEALLRSDPVVTFAAAEVLAQRLDLVTRFLADLQTQYGDAGGSLAVVDTVLAGLASRSGPPAVPGSVRDPEPPY